MKPPKEPPKKKGAPGPLIRLVALIFAPGVRWISVPAMLIGLAYLGGYSLWQRLRDEVVAKPAYRVTRDSIVLTQLPAWIHTDIAEEVLHQMNLSGQQSLFDDELTEHVAKAFSLHPWIAKVLRVEKRYPARVIVDVEYRRPVCMVEVPRTEGNTANDQGEGLYPVDAAGVLLPTADFSKAEARHYPRLAEIHTLPIGPVGTNWGDPRVTGAAEIAALLLADWEKLRLARMTATEQPQTGGSSDDYAYTLTTRDGIQIIWGQRPTSQLTGEVSAAEKLERLRMHLSSAREPAAGAAPVEIDIRYSQGVQVAPRTAQAQPTAHPTRQ